MPLSPCQVCVERVSMDMCVCVYVWVYLGRSLYDVTCIIEYLLENRSVQLLSWEIQTHIIVVSCISNPSLQDPSTLHLSSVPVGSGHVASIEIYISERERKQREREKREREREREDGSIDKKCWGIFTQPSQTEPYWAGLGGPFTIVAWDPFSAKTKSQRHPSFVLGRHESVKRGIRLMWNCWAPYTAATSTGEHYCWPRIHE